MNVFRQLAHLQEQLGDERFAALIDSGNTGKVKEFCDGLVTDTIPTTMTLGGRTYDILSVRQAGKESANDEVKMARTKDDALHILKHQNEIPAVLRGKIIFVFTDWRRPDSPEDVRYVSWYRCHWDDDWGRLVDNRDGRARVLRRHS